MAKGAVATPPAAGVTVPASNGTRGPRPRVAVEEIDWTAGVSVTDLQSTATDRRSRWTDLLEKLYAGTEQGQAPRGEDQSLLFVPLGTFNNVGGARTQINVFNKKSLDKTYEFKATINGKTSTLWARVIEVAE